MTVMFVSTACGIVSTSAVKPAVTLSEASWRHRAAAHAERTRSLLAPGLLVEDADTGTAQQREKERLRRPSAMVDWPALDCANPVVNFLHEYYHIRGGKGCRRLARFSPALPAAGGGTLLEGATAADFESGVLQSRGAQLVPGGVLYDAAAHHRGATAANATGFLWYSTVLRRTTAAEPHLSCYGMHEWAMQYHPEGAPPPPSSAFQHHLPLRVSRATINAAVERRGISCTHVDALRFFAPAAAPLNLHGATLRREQQAELEQPGCVHAHMDLLRSALRLSPWLPCELVGDCLEVSLAARTLDVAASPYDARAFGVLPVAVETAEGRRRYRREQQALAERAAPVRARLLDAYDAFLGAAFGDELVAAATAAPAAERFATATPGGKPWRRSLLV